MLTTLRIKNLALVADLTLELQPGLNVITGETGAGKSIIIGALNLVLGQRAERALLRAGADSCTVEAVFDVTKLRAPLAAFLEESGLEPCEEHLLVLKRTFTAAGANRQFVNGSATTLPHLVTLGNWLVDMHGPHDHQSLLYPANQLAILDAFGGLAPLREPFATLVRRRAEVEAAKAALIVDDKTYAQQIDLLRHQVHEIGRANLKESDETELEQEHRRASNAARLTELSESSREMLSEGEDSLLTRAGALGRALQDLIRIDRGATELADTHGQALAAWRELQTQLAHYSDRIDLDPARLQELEERLNLLQALKRKYGGTVQEILAFGAEASRNLHTLEERDTELARLNAELQQLDRELARAGQALSAARLKAIPRLAKAVVRQLNDLGFKRSHFEIELKADPLPGVQGSLTRQSLTGLDTIEFQFAPNPGEPARPLRAIASSGEMARVMLALKTALAGEDAIPVLVFDEVDANVGGETARVVGEKMLQIAHERQVLCITHLAPVAAHGSAHYVVTKETSGERTTSRIALLDPEARVTELARMLGGQSDAARKHAETLLIK